MLESIKHKNKLGFSLFEVVLTMGIVAIFIAACSNVFSQRHVTRNTNPAHGRVECYWGNDGLVHQRTFFENMLSSDQVMADGRCRYVPSRSAAYILMAAVGGGGHGGNLHGGDAGEYQNVFLSSTTHHMEIAPGKAADTLSTDEETGLTTFEPNGSQTIIYDKGTDGNDTEENIMYSLNGGISDSSADLRFKDCSVVFTEFACAYETSCVIDNDNKRVKVNYCKSNESPLNDPFKYGTSKTLKFDITSINDDDNILKKYLNTPTVELYEGLLKYDYTTYVWTEYFDSNTEDEVYTEGTSNAHSGWNMNDMLTYFSIALKIAGNYTEYEDISQMRGYIGALGIEGGIADLDRSAGNGGAKNAKGGDGAVVIVW